MRNLRIEKLRQILKKDSLDGLLISNFYNILYLTGFKTVTETEREAWLMVTHNNLYLFNDARYNSNLKSQNSNLKSKSQIAKLLSSEKGLIKHLQDIIQAKKIIRIGFEAEDLRVGELQRLKEKIPNIEWRATEKIVVRLREIKEEQEINQIKKACQISDQCLANELQNIKIGMTEKELAWRIESWIREHGYQLAFPPLVAIDTNSSIPHYDCQQGFGKVKKNSIILVDFGVKYKDYCSDMTRMVFFGKPMNQQINIYQKLLKTQQTTIEQCNNVNNLKEINSYCRLLIANCQLPDCPHSTGHGVGLEVHEYPKISQTSEDKLVTNQIFTIEPGVYFPGKWGMRIEDTIYISKGRKPNILTNFSKSLLIV